MGSCNEIMKPQIFPPYSLPTPSYIWIYENCIGGNCCICMYMKTVLFVCTFVETVVSVFTEAVVQYLYL